jgi:hypothetical protein
VDGISVIDNLNLGLDTAHCGFRRDKRRKLVAGFFEARMMRAPRAAPSGCSFHRSLPCPTVILPADG